MGREIELALEIKLAECDHVRGKRDRACSPTTIDAFFCTRAIIEKNFSSFDRIHLVTINGRNVISGVHVVTNRG